MNPPERRPQSKTGGSVARAAGSAAEHHRTTSSNERPPAKRPARSKPPLKVVAGLIWRHGRRELLIAKRHEHDSLGGYWEFPGGKVERGESYGGALRRELREELGIRTRVGQLVHTLSHQYPTRLIRIRFYNAWITGGTPRALDAAEMRWVKPEHLPRFKFPPADKALLEMLVAEARERREGSGRGGTGS